MMKICFINTNIYGVDGISRVLSVLANELSKKHDITVVTFEKEACVKKDRYNLSSRVHVDFWPALYKKCYIRRTFHKLNQQLPIIRKLDSKAIYDWIYLPKHMQDYWVEYINKNQFDVVVGVQAKLAIILGSIVDRISCKTIGWQHNSYEAYLENKGKYYWNQDFLFEKYIAKLDRYVVLNEHDEEQYRIKKNIDTVTIYNPKSFVSNRKSECIEKRFICVGGLRPAKGFDFVIQAFEEFAKYNSDWVLDIFGRGDDQKKLEKMIQSKGLEERVRLKGVSDQIQNELYQSGAFLLPSRWEGMPMVVLEAMEMGLPVVSFDITAINPLITNEKEGLIVKKYDTNGFADAMVRMAEDNGFRIRCSRNAVIKAKFFDVKVISEQWEKMLVDLYG